MNQAKLQTRSCFVGCLAVIVFTLAGAALTAAAFGIGIVVFRAITGA